MLLILNIYKLIYIHYLRHKGIIFLDQLISVDSAYLLDYKDIKQTLSSKLGRILRWYKFLAQHLILMSPHNRLNIDLDLLLIQNPQVRRPKVPATSDTTIFHKSSNKWIIT